MEVQPEIGHHTGWIKSSHVNLRKTDRVRTKRGEGHRLGWVIGRLQNHGSVYARKWIAFVPGRRTWLETVV